MSSEVAAAISLWGAADPDHVEAGAPPVLEMHGVVDTTVPFPLGTQACGLVIAWGGTCEQVLWPGERHAAFHRAPEILETSSNFLCRYVLAACEAPAPQAPITVSQ